MSFVPARNLLPQLLIKWAGKKNRDLILLCLGWKEIVGSLLAQRSRVSGLKKRVLYVTVKNNVWMQELVLAKSKILLEIKTRFALDIKDIVFIIG